MSTFGMGSITPHTIQPILHHGEIPKGLIIVFKDNNPMNCTIENLEAITRIENMRRNTYHRYPNELKRTIKLLKNVKSKLKSSESNPV